MPTPRPAPQDPDLLALAAVALETADRAIAKLRRAYTANRICRTRTRRAARRDKAAARFGGWS